MYELKRSVNEPWAILGNGSRLCVAQFPNPEGITDMLTRANTQPALLEALELAKACMVQDLGIPADECIGGDFKIINDALKAAKEAS